MTALYERLGATLFRATELTTGPWSPDAQHGGAPAALMAGVMQQVGTPAMFTARFTAEFLRPVPIARLEATAEVVRTGKRVEIISASLTMEGTPVAAARALRIRRHAGLDVPETPTVTVPPIPERRGPGLSLGYTSFVTDALDVRFVEGSMTEPGPATAWIRLAVDVVDDEPPTPLQRVLAAADCGNGMSSLADWHELLFINPDLTVHLHREPVGTWIFMRSATVLQPLGVGTAQSELFDETGSLGRALQSLYVDRL